MSRERRLGRGLEALLGRAPEPVGTPIRVPQRTLGEQMEDAGQDPYGGAAESAYADGPPADASAQPPVTEPGGADDAPQHDPPAEEATADATPPETLEHDSSEHETANPSPEAEAAPAATPAAADVPEPNSAVGTEATDHGGPLRLPIEQIRSNPYQPRQDFDDEELRTLAESIASHGLLQPVVVRPMGDHYQLIAGERRLRAAARAGWSDVPAQVIEADDRQTAELAIVENMQRKDLNPLEKAASFERYLEQYDATQEELASRLSLDRSTIANLIRLLELPEAVQEAIRQGRITQGHARALLPLGEEHEQNEFCQRIQREGLSVRQTEAIVQETIDAADSEPLGLVGRDGKKSRPQRTQSEHVAALEQEFRMALGTKVKLTHNARGRGKLVINFRNHEEFRRVYRHICGEEPAAESQVV